MLFAKWMEQNIMEGKSRWSMSPSLIREVAVVLVEGNQDPEAEVDQGLLDDPVRSLVRRADPNHVLGAGVQ